MPVQNDIVIACKKLCKSYHQGPEELQVLNGINLQVKAGERVAIVGASGEGKSTLLNMLGGLDLPTSGDIWVAGQLLSQMNEKKRGQIRNQYLGFVYQFHHLLGEFSALENVSMPLLIRGDNKAHITTRATAILQRVGLSERLSHRPSQLSGGERQRVAIARALVAEPRCVLLDEPTGNLDHHTATSIHALMNELNRDSGTSFIVVTHNPDLASSLDRTLTLVDGQLMETS